jgi:hypothetical protein
LKSPGRTTALLLSVAIFGFFATSASSASAGRLTEIQRIVVEEALNSRVPPALALAVARVESNFEPRAVSPVGARGVMQIMPKTARDVFGVGERELWNARLNIQLGTNFLRQLYEQYGRRWELALSHYNGGTLVGGAGPHAVPHSYTRKYVADVLRWQRFYENQSAVQLVAESGEIARKPATKPWRLPDNPSPSASTQIARAERPWRNPARVDPLDFIEWADVEQRRLNNRSRIDSSAAGDMDDDG